MTRLVLDQNILDNEVNPFGDIDFEKKVVPYKLVNHLVNYIVELPKLYPGIGVLVEDITWRYLPFGYFSIFVFEIFLHVRE